MYAIVVLRLFLIVEKAKNQINFCRYMYYVFDRVLVSRLVCSIESLYFVALEKQTVNRLFTRVTIASEIV